MLQTKALYNLLRLNAKEDPSFQADAWAVEDLRVLAVDELFLRLQKYQVRLDKNSFCQFSESCDTPEELTDLLLPDTLSEEEKDPFYLVVFELWRRFLPERQSLSIFCDEIDHRIDLYDRDDPKGDELIQDALANLLEVLEENQDAGADPKEIFGAVCNYCAHDVESFLYDYISDLLDSGNSLYASELIEGFSPFINDPLWFDFLRVRLLAFTDIGDANSAMHQLLENEMELSLVMEIIDFLSFNGEHRLFSLSVKKALSQLKNHDEFTELLTLVADYYRRLDYDDIEAKVQRIIDRQKSRSLSSEDIKLLQKLLSEPIFNHDA